MDKWIHNTPEAHGWFLFFLLFLLENLFRTWKCYVVLFFVFLFFFFFKVTHISWCRHTQSLHDTSICNDECIFIQWWMYFEIIPNRIKCTTIVRIKMFESIWKCVYHHIMGLWGKEICVVQNTKRQLIELFQQIDGWVCVMFQCEVCIRQ